MSSPLWHGLKDASMTSSRMESTLQHLKAPANVVGLMGFSGRVLQLGLRRIQRWQVKLIKMSAARLSGEPGSQSVYCSISKGSSHFGMRTVGSDCRLPAICFQVGASPSGYLASSSCGSFLSGLGFLGLRLDRLSSRMIAVLSIMGRSSMSQGRMRSSIGTKNIPKESQFRL